MIFIILVNGFLMLNFYLKCLSLIPPVFILDLVLHVNYFPIYLLSTICAHSCYNHTAHRSQKRKLLEVYWRCCWVLGVRNPRSIACEALSCRFPLKLCISDRSFNCCKSLLHDLVAHYTIMMSLYVWNLILAYI